MSKTAQGLRLKMAVVFVASHIKRFLPRETTWWQNVSNWMTAISSFITLKDLIFFVCSQNVYKNIHLPMLRTTSSSDICSSLYVTIPLCDLIRFSCSVISQSSSSDTWSQSYENWILNYSCIPSHCINLVWIITIGII